MTLQQHREQRIAYLLLFPAIAFLIGLVGYPSVIALILSLQRKLIGAPGKFIGLGNYLYLIKEPTFYKVWINTLIYTFGAVGIKLLLGLMAALLLNEIIKVRNLVRGLVFLPWAIPTYIAALTWRWMFDDLFGVISFVMNNMGLNAIPWLISQKWAMVAVIIATSWQGWPFFGIMLLAGLQTISKELYEAAAVDGASRWQRFIYITLPRLRSVILITSLLSTIWTFNQFEFIYIITRGGPVNATHIFPTYCFEVGIKSMRLGRGATVALFSAPFLVLLIILVTRIMLREE